MHRVALLAAASLVAKPSSRPPEFWPRFGGRRVVELLDGSDWGFGLVPLAGGFDSMAPGWQPGTADVPQRARVPRCMDEAPAGRAGYRG